MNMDRVLHIKCQIDLLSRELKTYEREIRFAQNKKMECDGRIRELEAQLSTVTGKPAA